MKIQEICSITSGLVLSRKKAENNLNPSKIYKLLTIKSFENDFSINHNELEDFSAESDIDNKYITKKGDIIVRLTFPYTAVYIDSLEEGLLISSNFLVLRNILNKFLPEYLTIVLNSENFQKKLAQISTGTKIPVIKVSSFNEIEFGSICPIEIQSKIIGVYKEHLNELNLLEQLTSQKKTLIKTLLNKYIE